MLAFDVFLVFRIDFDGFMKPDVSDFDDACVDNQMIAYVHQYLRVSKLSAVVGKCYYTLLIKNT